MAKDHYPELHENIEATYADHVTKRKRLEKHYRDLLNQEMDESQAVVARTFYEASQAGMNYSEIVRASGCSRPTVYEYIKQHMQSEGIN